MVHKHEVRIYCEYCAEYKRTIQEGDPYDESWKPTECSSHSTRDFVIEAEYNE